MQYALLAPYDETINFFGLGNQVDQQNQADEAIDDEDVNMEDCMDVDFGLYFGVVPAEHEQQKKMLAD